RVYPSSTAVYGGELYLAEPGPDSSGFRLNRFEASSGSFLGQLPQLPAFEHVEEGLAVGDSAGETQIYLAGDQAGSAGSQSGGTVVVLGASGSVLGKWDGSDTPSGTFGRFGG